MSSSLAIFVAIFSTLFTNGSVAYTFDTTIESTMVSVVEIAVVMGWDYE